MAVVNTVEVVADRSWSGRYRQPYTYSRSFLVKTDNANTSIVEVAQAPGIRYLSAHPDDPECLMQDFSCQAADESGLYYRVVFKYEPLPPNEDSNQSGGGGGIVMPVDAWSASGSITSGPATVDKDDKPIVNSAGDPIPEIEKDHAEFRIVLTRCVMDLSWTSVAMDYTNAVNSGSWNGSDARTWKCHFQNAVKRQESSDAGVLEYWETTWEFVYRPETWDLKPLNVGLQEKKGGKKVGIKLEGEPVISPVALDNTGKATPDSDPDVINEGKGVRVYPEKDFDIFGAPS